MKYASEVDNEKKIKKFQGVIRKNIWKEVLIAWLRWRIVLIPYGIHIEIWGLIGKLVLALIWFFVALTRFFVKFWVQEECLKNGEDHPFSISIKDTGLTAVGIIDQHLRQEYDISETILGIWEIDLQ